MINSFLVNGASDARNPLDTKNVDYQRITNWLMQHLSSVFGSLASDSLQQLNTHNAGTFYGSQKPVV
jgi:hypothetical protein